MPLKNRSVLPSTTLSGQEPGGQAPRDAGPGAASVCARCAAVGPTCCEPEPGVPLAALTPGDVERIQRATGLSASAFSEARPVDGDEQAFLQGDDPLLARLVSGGGLVSLSKRGRACVFLRAGEGCSLEWEVRPLLCRRFPIVRQGRYLNVRPGGRCLAVEESPGMTELLSVLRLTESELGRIERQVSADLAPAAAPDRGRGTRGDQ